MSSAAMISTLVQELQKKMAELQQLDGLPPTNTVVHKLEKEITDLQQAIQAVRDNNSGLPGLSGVRVASLAGPASLGYPVTAVATTAGYDRHGNLVIEQEQRQAYVPVVGGFAGFSSWGSESSSPDGQGTRYDRYGNVTGENPW